MRIVIAAIILFCGPALFTGSPAIQPAHAAATDSPGDVVAAYVAAMKRHDASPELDIYTTATREMLRSWRVNNAQMDNLVRDHAQCPEGADIINTAQTHAVVRYPVDARRCNPYFLAMEDGQWRLDLTMMQQGIQFNTRNEWHFIPGKSHPYWFAFEDWRLDKNGFPHPAW